MAHIFFWGEDKRLLETVRGALPQGESLAALPPGSKGLEEFRDLGGDVLICAGPAPETGLDALGQGGNFLVLELAPGLERPQDLGPNGFSRMRIPTDNLPQLLPGVIWAHMAGRSMGSGERLQCEPTDYLGSILGVAATFRVAGDAEAIFDQITSELVDHFPFSRAMLFLWEEGGLKLRGLTWRGGDEEELRRALENDPPYLDPESAEFQSLALGMAMPMPLEANGFFSPEASGMLAPAREAALAPLFTDQDFLGLVAADLGRGDIDIQQVDLSALEAYLTLVGTLIFNSWLFAELEENNQALELKVRELMVVNEMTSILNQGKAAGESANLMLAAMVRHLEAQWGFLFIYDPETAALRLAGKHGLDPKWGDLWQRLSGLNPEDFLEPSPAHKQAMARGEAGLDGLVPGLKGPCLAHILRSNTRVIGLWGLGRNQGEEAFSQGEEQIMTVADDQVGLAINSLRLEHLASTDPLTGLFTRRHFNESLDQELGLGDARGNTVSLVMLDVDHFKNVNDQYGHQAGDAVLASLAQTLRACTRRTDICARVGGEEFCLILPRCEQVNALNVAEKVRKNVSETVVNHRGRKIQVTVSLGVASRVPGSPADREELVHLADSALYRSKEQGRNRTTALNPLN